MENLESKKLSQPEKTGEVTIENKDEENPILESKKTEQAKRTNKETELVKKDSKWVGRNFDQDTIVDSRKFFSLEQYSDYLNERDGTLSSDVTSAIESGEAQVILKEMREKEEQKMEKFKECLEGLEYARVNPPGEMSPVSLSQAIEIKKDGGFEVKISPEFIKQIELLTEQCKDVTVVIPFYNHRRGEKKASDVPETEEQIQQYVALCQDIIEKTGGKIQLEIGNETNISRDTGKEDSNNPKEKGMFDKLQHASHVDPAEYAKFYYGVAKSIKEKFPEAKLSVAGVACFDPTYLRKVLSEVNKLGKEEKVDTKLVDTISFHPYRDDPEGGSGEVENGNFVSGTLSYKKQLIAMKDLGSEFGAELNVGEMNFPFLDKNWESKLKRANLLTKEQGVISYIHPGINVESNDSLELIKARENFRKKL